MISVLCSHGCGKVAQFQTKTGNFICLKSSNSCPAVRAKNALRLREVHASGTKGYTYNPKSNWSKGLSKETNESVAKMSKSMAETHARRAIESADERLKFQNYRTQCKWTKRIFEELYKIEGYELFKELGLYHKYTNKLGVVRDHRLSVRDGFKFGIDPSVMNHPANCRFLPHKENAKKTFKSELTVDELKRLIHNW